IKHSEIQKGDEVFLRKRFDTVKKIFKERIKAYSRAYPGDYKLLQQYLNNELDFSVLEKLKIDTNMAGRDLGNIVLNEIAKNNSNIICTSADLFSSTKAVIKDSGFINANFANRNLKTGIREFAMGAISNGVSLYGGLIPIQSTFMVFSDYLKPAIRLGALMDSRVISAFTHDSIAVGEDGPTHQPVEQVWGLRTIPKCEVFRPANLTETIASYKLALKYKGQSVIALSRQKLSNFVSKASDAIKGGYIVAKEKKGMLNAIIIATGSEVSIALDIKRILDIKGFNVRVVSMPCIEEFEKQSDKYKESIIPSNLKSIFSIEAGSTAGWYKYVGKYGKCFGVDDFGVSAGAEYVYNKFGLNSEDISKEIIKIIKHNRDKVYSVFDE
ncbi:MAG: transketolase-like TK C-terminal-containing protein, partial [Christensenellales bacterium]